MIDDPTSQHVQTRPVNLQVGSEQAFREAQEWLNACLSHEFCLRHPGAHATLPRRIINVQEVPRLIDHSGSLVKPQGRYAALSYCWGGDQTIKCTSTTITDLCPSLSTELPQTLLDAIRVTRKLGLQYLWIDALCIIQDDLADKGEEIGNMQALYYNATVTIVAANAPRCIDGFLLDRQLPEELAQNSVQLSMSCADGQNGTVSVSPITKADKEPIDVRAWTIQEALLSPRRLIYGSRQMWWVCPTKVEWDGPEQVIGADHPDQACLPYEILDDNIGRNSGRYNLTAERVAQRWGELVEQSTARDLTYAEDRLLVMDRFSRLLNTQYLAGLWRNNLINDMLWHCNDRASSAAETIRFPPSHTPSWSWGATRGKISWCSAPTLPSTTESGGGPRGAC